MTRKPPVLDKRYRRHRALTAEEQALWEMENGKRGQPIKPPSASGRLRESSEATHLPESPRKRAEISDRDRQEKNHGTRKRPIPVSPLLDAPTLAKLRKGALAVEATLDLHGHTRETAYPALQQFIARARKNGLKLVLVITGKGKTTGEVGVLRQWLPRWLEETALRGSIIAYDRAHDRHGGTGAWYVRLKKNDKIL